MDGMLPSDLIERLPLAWKQLRGLQQQEGATDS